MSELSGLGTATGNWVTILGRHIAPRARSAEAVWWAKRPIRDEALGMRGQRGGHSLGRVGRPVTRPALARSGQGDFHHPALPPPCLAALRGPHLDHDPRLQYRVIREEVPISLPGEARSLAAATQPFEPGTLRGVRQHPQAADVAVHPEVVVVPPQTPHEPFVLLWDGPMSMPSAEVMDSLNCPLQSRTPRLERQLPSSASGSTPVQRESGKVERSRSLAPLSCPRRSPEWHEPSLLRVQGLSLIHI